MGCTKSSFLNSVPVPLLTKNPHGKHVKNFVEKFRRKVQRTKELVDARLLLPFAAFVGSATPDVQIKSSFFSTIK